MCVLCVQEIAKLQRELQDPSISTERRRDLQVEVQERENRIKRYKSSISSLDADIKQHQAAMAALQGEPFCVAIATVDFYLKIGCHAYLMLTDCHAHCHANYVAMVTNWQLQLS